MSDDPLFEESTPNMAVSQPQLRPINDRAHRRAQAAQERQQPPQEQPVPATPQPPQTVEEAEQRFWRRYGPELLALIVEPVEQPTTIDGWMDLARQIRPLLQAQPAARAVTILERVAAELRASQSPVQNGEAMP